MKIIALEAENLKRLTAIRIEPDGNLVQITGKNGQGKTSVLDAIWWALDGTTHVQSKPIRQGEEQAVIKLDLGELKVTRKFRAKEDGTYTTSIIVENGEGARFPSPQKMLDELLGELTFDPLAFTRMKDQDQVHALRSLVPDFDFAKAEQEIKEAFDERAICNRTARDSKTVAEEISRDLPEEIPEFIEDSTALHDAYAKAVEESAECEARQAKKDRISNRIIQIEEERRKLMDEWTNLTAELEAVGDIPDLEAIQDKIAKARASVQSVEVNNRIAEKAKTRDFKFDESKKAEAKSIELTRKIDSIKAQAKEAIASADMPIKGLSISNGAVHLDNVPFEQASDAQQLQASIGIAMALNPTLKVIRVRDGSLLDQDAMQILAKMADDKDYQIWIERVDGSGKVGFVLEDGHLKQESEPAGLFDNQKK